MHRRNFLKWGTLSTAILAGCTQSDSVKGTRSTQSKSELDTSRGSTGSFYVDPEGSDSFSGAEDAPLQTIQEAFNRASAGDTIYVNPGRYHEEVETVRSGTAENPIKITGPPEAVIHGSAEERWYYGFLIRHSHIHISGLTIDGFADRSNPDEATSYIGQGVKTEPHTDEYLDNLVIKPHGIGNVRGAMINLSLVKNVEVGEFRVIGPAGLNFELTGETPGFGEIVYMGTGAGNVAREMPAFEEDDLPGGLDQSSGIHIHHIDNSAGYDHSELVDVKFGASEITIEYCTDIKPSGSGIRIAGHGVTVRWCELQNGENAGIEVGSEGAARRQNNQADSELLEVERRGGTLNAIYGNKVIGFTEKAFSFPIRDHGQTPDNQEVFCGNEYDGQTEGNPAKVCPEGVPKGDGIGHLGGDSPWG